MNVIYSFKDYIINNFNTFINSLDTELELLNVSSSNVVIDEVDTDKKQFNFVVYILPEEAEYERNTTSSDLVRQNVKVMFFVRGGNNIERLFLYNTAFKQLIRSDLTLSGLVNDCFLNSTMYWEGVEGTKDIKAIEYNMVLEFMEDY